MRRPILAANWKMHKTTGEAEAFAKDFLERVGNLSRDAEGVDVVVAPPFTALDRLGRALEGSAVALAAQDVGSAEEGAYTGAVSARMLVDVGCSYGIVGHSERRALFGERDEDVAAKAAALLRHGIRPIVCVGESLEQRDAGRTLPVVEGQLRGSLAEVPPERAPELVIAYEPVWAIGTGRTATPEIAQEVHAAIRDTLRQILGEEDAGRVRLQYGGSVKPDNVAKLMARPDIDGALVGGASLEAESFARIVHYEREAA